MAISQVVDSTGTTLNRYKLLIDGVEKEVTLTFYPSQDYVAGTAFNATTMNPWVALLNGLNNLKFVVLTESEYQAMATHDSGTLYFRYSQ